jgi:polyferredoxin
MTRSRTALLALLLVGGLALAACAAGPNNVATVSAPHIAGFWFGLWHGIICPVTFIVSLFNDNVNIYDVHNNGNWYNFGFVLGVSIVFGGGSRASAR